MSSSGGATKGNALIAETIQHMWRLGGARIFFRGLPAGLVGVFPYAALDMSTYELLKLTYSKWVDEEPGVAASLTMGALSGGLGATSVYPLNLVRTRLQAQGTPAHPARYDGIVDAARQCYRNEGWRGFYKGALNVSQLCTLVLTPLARSDADAGQSRARRRHLVHRVRPHKAHVVCRTADTSGR